MNFAPYRKFFSPASFWKKLSRFATAAGTKTVYASLLLYYAYEREDTPAWAKRIVLGALGYLVMPLDFIPDISPVVGYTDDIGVLGAGLAIVAAYVNGDVKAKARLKLGTWFKEVKEEDLQDVEKKL